MSLELSKRVRRVVFAGLIATTLLLLSGCSEEHQSEIKRLAMPIPSTKEAPAIYDLWRWSWLAAILTGIVVWGLIIYASIRFRRRSETEIPVQTRYNLPIEIFYTLAPVMMVIVFFYFTVDAQNKSDHVVKNPDHDVTVVGQQWSWTFNYNLKYDGNKGSDIGYGDQGDADNYVSDGKGEVVHEGGTTANRPTLWLVKGQSVTFWLHSPDVIHSFWVPSFLFKMDVVPGRHNHFSLTPTRTGTFEGRCAELCGVYHSRMLFNVKVVDQAAYDEHLKELADQGNTGPALGATQDMRTPGLESSSTGGE